MYPLPRGISLFVLVALMLIVPNAIALAPRTFVASYGSDSNSCSLSLPCRTFTAAIAQVSVGGDVVVLDSAGYGPVLITNSVKILAPPGVLAAITVTSFSIGVHVNMTGPGVVVLHGLTITVTGPGSGGIVIEGGASVRVEGCTIYGSGDGVGIGFHGSLAATMSIDDSRVSGFLNGIQAESDSFKGKLTLHGSFIEFNFYGVELRDNTVTVIDNTIIRNNAQDGLFLLAGLDGPSSASVSDSVISHNSNGIEVSAVQPGIPATLTLNNNTITNSNVGLFAKNSGGPIVIYSRQNNTFSQNDFDTYGSPVIMPIAGF